MSTRLLFCTFVLSLFIKSDRINILKQSWDIFLFLTMVVAGLIYSEDFLSGLHVLETSFSLLSLPLIMFKIRELDKKKLNQVFYVFTLGLIVASLFCLINAVINYFNSRDIHVFFFENFTKILNSHPTYFACYLIAAITILLYLFYYEEMIFSKVWYIFVLLFFFVVLILTGGQTTFISMLLVLSFFIMKFLIDDKAQERRIVFTLSCLMIVGMFITYRVLTDNRDTMLTDSWERFILWESALKANPDFLLGVGTGDYKSVLNKYYTEHNLTEFAKDSYNSHNQFIHTFLSNGFIGLVALLIMLGRPLYLAFKNNHSFGILVFFPFLIYGMTEVFLGRYQGVVFFALLHQVFVSYYISSKPAFSLKEA